MKKKIKKIYLKKYFKKIKRKKSTKKIILKKNHSSQNQFCPKLRKNVTDTHIHTSPLYNDHYFNYCAEFSLNQCNARGEGGRSEAEAT